MKKGHRQAEQFRPRAEYSINGKAASLAEIAEASGDKEAWRSYLERERDLGSLHRYLEKYLGKYVTAREIHWPPGMRNAALRKWKSSGKVRAEHVRGRWYYSLEDLLRTIREE
ncbi:MAG: hypothetical protein R6U93_07300 [Dehalococcoidia bacterium]